MSRLMSVALTEAAVRERRKTVTRRLNWWENKRGHRILNVGDKLTLCPKVQGRRRGGVVEPLDRIVKVTVTDIRREPLWAGLSDIEVAREGFPDWTRLDFYLFFRDTILDGIDDPSRIVTRIEWAYPTPTRADIGRMMDAVEATPDRHHPHVWQISRTVWNDLLIQYGAGQTWTRESALPPQVFGHLVVFDEDAPGGIQFVRADQTRRTGAVDQHAAAVAAALPYPGETR